MAIPGGFTPTSDRVVASVEGVVAAVNAARFDERTDDPGSGLGVGDVLGRVEGAQAGWLRTSDDLEDALDAAAGQGAVAGSEIGSARCALALLNVAVAAEVAVVVALEGVDPGSRLADVVSADWSAGGESFLEPAALGDGTADGVGLVTLLYAGTDDVGLPVVAGNVIPGNYAVDHAVDAILRQSADVVRDVFVGLPAGPVVGLVGFPPGVPEPAAEFVRWLVEQFGEWAWGPAADELPGRVRGWVRQAMKRARRLLDKALGGDKAAVVGRLGTVLDESPVLTVQMVIAQAMVVVFGTDEVRRRGYAGINSVVVRRRMRSEKLAMLEASNRAWLWPAKKVVGGLGPLWGVSIPCGAGLMPVAPAAAVVVLAWVVLLGGDQLDTPYAFPDFFAGVVRRSWGR